MEQHGLELDLTETIGGGSAVVAVFQPGRMLTTMAFAVVRQGRGVYLKLEQEEVDKGSTKEVFGCSESADDGDEDDCLLGCLLDKCVRDFGCVHPRSVGRACSKEKF